MDLNNGVCGHDHPCFKLVEEVRWRLSDVEAYTLSHVDRDANKFANVFAHYVVSNLV